MMSLSEVVSSRSRDQILFWHTASSIIISTWSAILNRAATEITALSSVSISIRFRAHSSGPLAFLLPGNRPRRGRAKRVMKGEEEELLLCPPTSYAKAFSFHHFIHVTAHQVDIFSKQIRKLKLKKLYYYPGHTYWFDLRKIRLVKNL